MPTNNFREDMKLSLDIFVSLGIQYVVSKTPFRKEEHIEVLLQKIETQISLAEKRGAEEMKAQCLAAIPEEGKSITHDIHSTEFACVSCRNGVIDEIRNSISSL